MPVASMALRYEGKGHKSVPMEGNLLLHNPEKNDNAIIQSLCECGGVRHDHDSSVITPSKMKSLEVNRQRLGGEHFKALVCVCSVHSVPYQQRPSFLSCGQLLKANDSTLHVIQSMSNAPDSWIPFFFFFSPFDPLPSGLEHTDRGVKHEVEHERAATFEVQIELEIKTGKGAKHQNGWCDRSAPQRY